MKTIHISYGGPDRRIRDATGKVWRFEMHPYCGPGVQDDSGELADRQPGQRSQFWEAVNLWACQGAVNQACSAGRGQPQGAQTRPATEYTYAAVTY